MAKKITHFGTVVAVVRATIRDLIAMLVWEVIRNAAIALAPSIATFGAAAAAFAAWTAGRAAVVFGKIMQLVAKVMRVAGKIAGRFRAAASGLGDALKGLSRFGRGARSADGAAGSTSAAARNADAPAGAGGRSATGPSAADRVDGAGQRMVDWGNARPSTGDVGAKGKEGLRQFGQGYKNAGNTYHRRVTEPIEDRAKKLPGGEGAVKAADAYTPYGPRQKDGHVSPHSRPDPVGFPVKAGADSVREVAKIDDSSREGLEGETAKKDYFARRTGTLDE